jgi:hypothetical protein
MSRGQSSSGHSMSRSSAVNRSIDGASWFPSDGAGRHVLRGQGPLDVDLMIEVARGGVSFSCSAQRCGGTDEAAPAEHGETTCCYARQDKFWVQDAPDGERWEIYTVLADSQTFYAEGHGPGCCGGADVRAGEVTASPAPCC